MRPRVFPAEDGLTKTKVYVRYLRASMRPRVFPAEDVIEAGGTRVVIRELQ